MPRFQVLSEAQWSLIAELLPRPTGESGPKFSDVRTMIEGIVYRYRAGVAWRDLPEVYGPWQTMWPGIDARPMTAPTTASTRN